MDVGALTTFLVPFLPYLADAGQRIAEEAGRQLAPEAWEYAKRIWAKLRPKLEEKAAAQEAVSDVATRPDDERARGAFELQLEKLLAEQQALAEDLGRLWEEARSAGVVSMGDRSIAVGRDARGTFITGDQNIIER